MASDIQLASPSAARPSIAVKQLSGVFGAQISGIDLSKDLDADALDHIYAALDQYRVLVFRDQQNVQPRHLLQFASHFGEPETAEHPQHPDYDGVVGVKVLRSDAKEVGNRFADSWHTDGATRTDTRYISVLQAIDIPEYGRDTLFADMVTAYERLSAPIKDFLETLTAEHNWGLQKPGSPSVYHPVILTCRRTGARALYVNRVYTKSIKGLRSDESDALLDFLFKQARIPELQLRVSWEPGTIVMWNNELTQHYLVFDRAYPRVMHRVMAT